MSLFGSTTGTSGFTFPSTTSAATTSTTSPSLFGSSTPSKPLFGSTTQASSTPSLFGTTTTTQASTPSLFGSTTTKAATGTLFGGSPAGSSLLTKRAGTSTATPSLFGTTTTTSTTPGGSLFGTSTKDFHQSTHASLHEDDAVQRPQTSRMSGQSDKIPPSESTARGGSPRPPAKVALRRRDAVHPTLMPIDDSFGFSSFTPEMSAFLAKSFNNAVEADADIAKALQFSPPPITSMAAGDPGSGIRAVVVEPTPEPPAPKKASSAECLPNKHSVPDVSNPFAAPVIQKPIPPAIQIQSQPAPQVQQQQVHTLVMHGNGGPIPTVIVSAPPPTPTQRPSQLTGMTFSSSTTGGTSLFGSTSTATGSLFSKPATGGGLFGSTQQQQQQQQQVSSQQQVVTNYHPFVKAVAHPQITGTDNDKFIAKLNQAAAALGVGKAPYKENNQIQTFDMTDNFFEKFVGIGYNKISEHTNDEGIVTLAIKYELHEINTEERKAKILEAIANILGNQPNIQVQYAPGTTLRSLPGGFTEIAIIVKEGGFVVEALKLAQVLNDGPKLAQLETQLRVDKKRVLPKVGMSKAQKERYLETVPRGVDEKVWRQAIAENPSPNKMLPVVVRGWEELLERQKAQNAEQKVVKDALTSLFNRIEKVESDHARAQVEMEAIRCRHKQLSYRLVRIMLAQWITQKFSRQIDTDEDQIEARCDTLLAQLNRHNQIQSWIAKFYEVLEKNSGKLREGAEKAYDMSEDDQKYARTFLTEILYIGERLVETNQIQMEDLETIKRTLLGE
ncbi:unnamed protein product [Caenorhabditis bovis]|uniref:Nucleoporin Nup54 alpha-helical domain-containing protein n=1 Tax=Caenorhabditis bovis TaxID=2654633 RepID=A0A8S1F1P1_9PELO|nr:unnamed protein product [Caenorhabditis bovis]